MGGAFQQDSHRTPVCTFENRVIVRVIQPTIIMNTTEIVFCEGFPYTGTIPIVSLWAGVHGKDRRSST